MAFHGLQNINDRNVVKKINFKESSVKASTKWSVIRQKGESENGYFKKTKHAKWKTPVAQVFSVWCALIS